MKFFRQKAAKKHVIKEASSKPSSFGGGLKFFRLKTVWVIVWIRKWYHLIALHPENILSTQFDVIQHLKNFLQLPEV